MNKMDEFFRKQLTDFQPADDEWNVPPLHVYEKAQEAFPRRKKNRGFIFFILLGVLGAAGLVASHLYDNDAAPTRAEMLIDEAAPVASSASKAGNSEYLTEITAVEKSEIIASKKEAGGNLVNEENGPQSEIEEAEFIQSEPILPTTAESIARPSVTIDESSSVGDDVQRQTSHPSDEPTNVEVVSMDSDPERIGLKTEENTFVESERILETNNVLSDVTALQTNWNRTVQVSQPVPVIGGVKIKSDRFLTPRRELGLNYGLYPIGLVEEIEAQDGPDTDVRLEFSQTTAWGVSGYYRQWLTPRWSLQSGLNFVCLKTDIDLQVRERLDSESIGLLRPYGRFTSRSSELDIDPDQVALKEGVDLSEGDLVDIRSNTRLRVKSVELPIMINRHWYKKNGLEYHAGLGAALYHFKVVQEASELFFLEDDQLINEPFIQEQAEVEGGAITIYGQGGISYGLNDKFRIGINTRISVLNPLQTALDVGVRYRWTK